MSKKSKLTTTEILKKMFEDDADDTENGVDSSDESAAEGADSEQIPDRDAVRCPRCGSRLRAGAKRCDKCGYNGYIPMSDGRIFKTRLILFIIFAVIAAAVYLLTR